MSLGPDARDLIAMADGADDPSSADEARIRAKLAARLAVAAGTGIAAGTAAKTAAASTGTAATTTLAAKIAIGVAVVSATTAGGTVAYEHVMHDRAQTTVVVEAPSKPIASASASASPSASASAIPEPTLPPPTVTAHVAATATAIPEPKPTAKPAAIIATIPDTIAEEASLLRAAHASLASNDGTGAMRSLDEHARRFPHGALAEERDAARVMALCAQGRASEARASASAFVSANPRSPFAAQVRRSCAVKEPSAL